MPDWYGCIPCASPWNWIDIALLGGADDHSEHAPSTIHDRKRALEEIQRKAESKTCEESPTQI